MDRATALKLTGKSTLTNHDWIALRFIQETTRVTDRSSMEQAEHFAKDLGAQPAYRRLFRTFKYDGMHVMHYAGRYSHLILTYLLHQCLGVDINTQDSTGRGILHMSTNANYIDQAVTLGAEVNMADKAGLTPLHLSLLRGNRDMALVLLNRGANPDVSSFFGKPIHAAATQMGGFVLDVLLEQNGLDVNEEVDGGFTPLSIAVQHGAMESINALLQGGADVLKSQLISKAIIADLPCTELIVDMLLKHGALVDEFDEAMAEDVPIIAAAKRKQVNVVKLLNERTDVFRKHPFPDATSVFDWVESPQFIQNDETRVKERVDRLRPMMVNALKDGNYHLASYICMALKKDLSETDWDQINSLKRICEKLAKDGLKPKVTSGGMCSWASKFKKEKMYDRALQAFKACLVLDPDNSVAKTGITDILKEESQPGTSGRTLRLPVRLICVRQPSQLGPDQSGPGSTSSDQSGPGSTS